MAKICRIRISGVVQGVGFRPFVFRTAGNLGLRGYVKNLGDGGVEIIIDGGREDIKKFLTILEKGKPANAGIGKIETKSGKSKKKFSGFKIVESGGGGLGGVVPPDVCICDECVKEIYDKENRRYWYPFTACTDCGPRFTTLTKIPYDRINTAFGKFKVCGNCKGEYTSPDDRRFRAEIISCSMCGPGYFLLDKKGGEISDPVESAIKFLKKGKIICIKGIGGIHIACNAADDNTVMRLRNGLNRSRQPFAVMCSDLEMVGRFADVNDNEKKLLISRERPIVVVKKSGNFSLSGFISPGLDSIGILLPYTALHSLLFAEIKEPIIMTSANVSGEPMLVENEDALNMKFADFFLLNNLEIENRCDDSVARSVNNGNTFIRRSRGFVPLPIDVENNSGADVLAVGAELNVTACLLKGKSAFLSQHIGNTRSPATIGFLKNSINHLINIANSKPDVIACDLHPDFHTTRIAEEFSRKFNAPVIRIQHHYAHLSSLAAEHKIDEIVGICCDGAGYGNDGKIWGGEIIVCKNGKFERIAHLKEQKMPGGDAAVYYPARMVSGILHDCCNPAELKKILIKNRLFFRYGRKEIGIVIKQLQDGRNIQRTTSAGRVLDAISSLLGICGYRSYDGEPAMKLECAGNKGAKLIDFPVSIKNNVLDTTKILQRVLQLKEENYKIPDIALSAETALAKGFAEIAIRTAKKAGISTVGISGGVACNDIIVKTIANQIKRNKLKFLQHEKVPCGDGGISLGQAMCAVRDF